MALALTDAQWREVRQAGQLVPIDLRSTYLEQLVLELQGQDLAGGADGLVHRAAYKVARARAGPPLRAGLPVARRRAWERRGCRRYSAGGSRPCTSRQARGSGARSPLIHPHLRAFRQLPPFEVSKCRKARRYWVSRIFDVSEGPRLRHIGIVRSARVYWVSDTSTH